MTAGDRHRRWLPLIGLGAAGVVAAVVVWSESRGASFYGDEWNFIMNRRGGDLETYFAPHNDHLALVPVAIFKLLFETVGLDSYRVYVAVLIVFNLLVGGLMYLVLRRRLGELVAVLAAALVMTLGPAWEDLLWPFQIAFFAPLAAGLGAILMLERDDRVGDVVAGVLLAVALASSGGGVPFAAALVVYAIATQRRLRGRLLALGIPIALYGIWASAYREEIGAWRTTLLKRDSVVSFDTVAETPRIGFDFAAHASAAATPFSTSAGPALVTALVAFAVWRLVAARTPLTPGLWAVGALTAVHFLGTALVRTNQPPDSSRYVYPGIVVFLLVLAYLIDRAPAGTRARAVICAVAGVTILANLGELRRADKILTDSSFVGARLAAVELVPRDRVPPDYRPDLERAPDIRAEPYFAAVDSYGSPARPLDELPGLANTQRQEADGVLVELLDLTVKPAEPVARGRGPVAIGANEGVEVTQRAGCAVVRPPGPDRGIEIGLPPAGLIVQPDGGGEAEVRLRRFSDVYPGDPIGAVAGGEAGRVPGPPPDRSERPWNIRVSSAGPFRVCSI